MQIFVKMKRKEPPQVSKNHKRGYNQVAYVRHGKDHVMMDGSGAAGGQEVKTVWVTAKNGQKWEIPVDDNGRVPNEYLYGRFYSNWGSRSGKRRDYRIDIGVDSETMHQIPDGGFTPQQLIQTGWWQYPNESDIEDIDDTGALALAREIEGTAKSAKYAGKGMVFLMPPESAARARAILAKDFTGSELTKAVRHGGIIFKEGNPGRGNSGCYVSMQEDSSIKTPTIILKKGEWDEETLVHEFTHHLRHVDVTRDGLTRSPYKFNEFGERKSAWNYNTKEYNSNRNLEEASTIAESYVRIQDPPNGATGYYTKTRAHGKTPDERSKYDRKTLVPVAPKRGRAAERQVKNKFGETSISHLGYYRPGMNAASYLNARTKAGTMPKAQKALPAPKKSNVAAGTHAGGRTGVTATKKKSTSGAKKKARR